MSVSAPILQGDHPYTDLQRAVCATLAAELAPVKVYDYAPENAQAPYVTFNIAWDAERDSLNGCADRAWFQIDVWSQYRGYAEASLIAEQIVRRLHHAIVYLPGYSPIHLLREQSHRTRDPDGRHRRVALTFHSPYVSPLPGGK